MTDFEKALAIMEERFGRDRMISLATAVDNLPSVRDVNGYYRDGAFYIVTHALSGKMQQIAVVGSDQYGLVATDARCKVEVRTVWLALAVI